MTHEPKRRISSLRSPAGLANRLAPRELVHTSSARFGVWWAGVILLRTHFEQVDVDSLVGRLPRSFCPRKAAADDRHS